jgi:hypothetical protein
MQFMVGVALNLFIRNYLCCECTIFRSNAAGDLFRTPMNQLLSNQSGGTIPTAGPTWSGRRKIDATRSAIACGMGDASVGV